MPKTALLAFLLGCLAFPLFAQKPYETARLTIREEAIPVGKLLKEISRQAGVDFSFNSKVVDTKAIVSFQVEEASLEESLQLLAEKLEIAYALVEGQVVLNFADRRQEVFVLSGFLSDQKTGENLIGATVAVVGTPRGTVTNEFGYYALHLPQGVYQVSYSYLGFENVTQEIDLQQDLNKLVALPPARVDLPEVIVQAPLEELQSQNALGKLTLSPDRLNNLPEFGGESGLIKGLQSLPGMQTHSDGSAFFYARGGERDQNLIIIDDAPIYNPSHLFGFYSLVIPDFAKQITVHKSDLPASMGDRLSSIVSIRTQDGNLNKAELSGAVNPLVNRLSVSLPVVKQRSALFATFRSSNFRWIYQAANADADIRFWDLHLKFNYRINDKNRLFFTSIRGGDVLSAGGGPLDGIRWGNTAATLRWNHVFGPKVFFNATLNSGNYAYNLVSSSNYWKSELGTISLKADFTQYANPRYTAKFGFELQSYFTNPGEVNIDSTLAILPDIASDESRKQVLYYQSTFDLSAKMEMSLGLRFINWENLGPKTYYLFDENYAPSDTLRAPEGVYNRFTNLDPRLSLRYQLDSTSQLKLSFGVYHQYLQLIQNSISPFTAFEVWLPAGPNIRPQAANQWALDYLKFFPRSNISFSGAAYYKTARNQIDYEAHATTYLNPFIESELRFGESRAYGVEFMLKKDFGRLNGWVKYGYARVFRRTKDINGGDWYPAFQDRPHDFSLVVNYDLARRTRFTAFWTSHTGSTFTSPVGFYTFNDQTVPLYGERNNDRLPAYHRLDIAFRFLLHKKEAAAFRHSLTFSIYNVLAHQNVFAVKFNKVESPSLNPPVPVNTLANELLSPSQIDLIRFFPSLTYKFNL